MTSADRSAHHGRHRATTSRTSWCWRWIAANADRWFTRCRRLRAGVAPWCAAGSFEPLAAIYPARGDSLAWEALAAGRSRCKSFIAAAIAEGRMPCAKSRREQPC